MKALLALFFGACSGALVTGTFLSMLALMVPEVSLWVSLGFFGATWFASVRAVESGAKSTSRVACNGFLVLAVEFGFLALATLAFQIFANHWFGDASATVAATAIALVAVVSPFLGLSAFCLLGFIVAHLIGQEYRPDAEHEEQDSTD